LEGEVGFSLAVVLFCFGFKKLEENQCAMSQESWNLPWLLVQGPSVSHGSGGEQMQAVQRWLKALVRGVQNCP
jgi:hypothetical protein